MQDGRLGDYLLYQQFACYIVDPKGFIKTRGENTLGCHLREFYLGHFHLGLAKFMVVSTRVFSVAEQVSKHPHPDFGVLTASNYHVLVHCKIVYREVMSRLYFGN
jgi:hypothetical protein